MFDLSSISSLAFFDAPRLRSQERAGRAKDTHVHVLHVYNSIVPQMIPIVDRK